MRLNRIQFDADFGAPDMGDFSYGGLAWNTNLELAVKDGSVQPRLNDPWTLILQLVGATRLDVDVRLAAGGSATLHGWGTGVSPNGSAQGGAQGQTATLTLTGSSLDAASLTGTGVAVLAIRYSRPFVPVLPSGPLRLLNAILPLNAADMRHCVGLVGYADADLAGWSVQVYAAQNPGPAFVYHAFAGGTLKDARVARIYGGLAGGRTDPGVDLYFGGAGGTPSPSGAVFQLVDPAGVVRHELAVLPSSVYASVPVLGLLPNGDGTKAFIFLDSATAADGYWQLELTFAWQGDADLPTYSIGGDSQSNERGTLSFGFV